MARVLKLAPDFPLEYLIDSAAAILARGGAIAYPTETFYGLGVDAGNEEAIRRIFDVKGRDFKNPVSVIIGHVDQLIPLAGTIPDAAQKLISAFWPGPLTIVFEAARSVSPLLTAGTGKLGIRLSSHAFARRLTLASGKPLTATSANLSGAPECADADAVIRQIGGKIDAVIDLGEKGGTVGSTIIDATLETMKILRMGVVTREEIEQRTGLQIR
jgi:L-threonylcarbamoyladenylate synthase